MDKQKESKYRHLYFRDRCSTSSLYDGVSKSFLDHAHCSGCGRVNHFAVEDTCSFMSYSFGHGGFVRVVFSGARQGPTVADDVVEAKEKMQIAASPNETEKNVAGCFVQDLCGIVI
ncbi:hypothetical protein Tco_0714059 [Tanacetum coccineum]